MLALPDKLDDDGTADDKAAAMARVWLARMAMQTTATTPVLAVPANFPPAMLVSALAELVALVLGEGKTILMALPDDQLLPEISNAVDLVLRPLCLVLPSAPFAARVVVRATLSLLKGRLRRGLDDDADSREVKAWRTQQQRVDASSAAWQACLAWAANDERERDWPDDLAGLFPVGIVGGTRRAVSTEGSSLGSGNYDYALALTPASLPEQFARRQLLLQVPRQHGALLQSDGEALLRAELAILIQEVGDMELELATIQAGVGEFARRYYERVGALLTELDTLRASQAKDRADNVDRDEAATNDTGAAGENARQAAREAADRAERSRQEHARYTEYVAGAAQPFCPNRDFKRLFRRIAQKIHPDRADDEEDRQWRTQLMSEANRAYRCSDETALRDVLALWQRGQEGRGAAYSIPPNEELTGKIQRIRQRLAEIEAELRRLFTSPLYELFIAARLARRQGRELLDEMAADLATQIANARQN